MVVRMSFLADGRNHAEELPQFDTGAISPTHVEWVRSLLRETPAAFQVFVDQTDQGVLRLEWQAVMQGTATGYLMLDGRISAACVLLEGRFPIAERAAVEALQGTLGGRKSPTLQAGFELLRKSRHRQVRALFVTETLPDQVLGSFQYWSDCLAIAYLARGDVAPTTAATRPHCTP